MSSLDRFFRTPKLRLSCVWHAFWPLTILLMAPEPTTAQALREKPGLRQSESPTVGIDLTGSDENNMEVYIVDAANSTPLAGASIQAFAARVNENVSLLTNSAGRCRLAIPKESTRFFGIIVKRDRFVPARVAWRGTDFRAKLPTTYTLALEAGTPIGGSVRDQRGQPVAGAMVYVWFEEKRAATGAEEIVLTDEFQIETDARGGWRSAMGPAKLNITDQMMCRIIHPNFVSEPLAYRRTLPIDELRAMTSVMVMEDGVPLSGRVVDSRRLPVAQALLDLRDPGYPIAPARLTAEQAKCVLTQTDADGYFRFDHLEPGGRDIMVGAPGFISRTASVVVGETSTPAEICLTSVEEMEEGSRVARAKFKQMLAADDAAGPNDIPQKWVIYGTLLVVAGVLAASLISWLWTVSRRGQKVQE